MYVGDLFADTASMALVGLSVDGLFTGRTGELQDWLNELFLDPYGITY
jgi:hypothetical protein